jgi:purine-binding chemotaxis protein CheW
VQIGNEKYGIDINYIDNIVRMSKITRVPKVQSYFKGVMNLRGEIVPVMSIRKKMGLPDDVITDASRIIILKVEEKGSLGVVVDQVREVITLNMSEVDKTAVGARNVKDSILRVTGKDYRLGIHNSQPAEKAAEAPKKDPLQNLISRARGMGVNVDVK